MVLAAVVSLGSAEPFSIIGASGVTASGTMRVTGNVGAGSGGVTGIAPVVGDVVPGADALKDVAAALAELAKPRNDIHVIHMPNLMTRADSSTPLPPGFDSSHVFWLVDGPAELGERSTFVGTLIAKSIIVHEGVTVSGRLIAVDGTVTLANDDINLCCDPIAQSALPNGTANVPYPTTKIAADGGTAPYTFSLFSGSLPSGLTLAADGTVSGVPTSAGSSTFIVMVTDYKGCTSIHTHKPVICDTTTVEPPTLPDAISGYAYNVRITTKGGTGTHVFTTTPLPDVMTLTPASCAPEALLCGTPNRAGGYKFTITATACDGSCSGSREYTLKVVCPVITVLPATLDAGTVGTLYRKVIMANGSLEPYSFTAEPSIPPGVTVDPFGVLSFTPGKAGDYTFKVKATDSHGCSGTRDYTIKVCPIITITPESLPTNATSVQLGADPPGSYVYEFSAPDRPASVTLLTTGLLDWSNTPPGDYSFAVIATREGCSGSRVYELHVPPFVCPKITILPTTLTRGTLGVLYDQTIQVVSELPYTVQVTGSVPPPLSQPLHLLGTPTVAGVYPFTVTVTTACRTVSQAYSIAIEPPSAPGAIVPALSPWALVMLAVLLGVTGVLLIRRG